LSPSTSSLTPRVRAQIKSLGRATVLKEFVMYGKAEEGATIEVESHVPQRRRLERAWRTDARYARSRHSSACMTSVHACHACTHASVDGWADGWSLIHCQCKSIYRSQPAEIHPPPAPSTDACTHTHARPHARTHARARARTHARAHAYTQSAVVRRIRVCSCSCGSALGALGRQQSP
jgi:hypothetical protein